MWAGRWFLLVEQMPPIVTVLDEVPGTICKGIELGVGIEVFMQTLKDFKAVGSKRNVLAVCTNMVCQYGWGLPIAKTA